MRPPDSWRRIALGFPGFALALGRYCEPFNRRLVALNMRHEREILPGHFVRTAAAAAAE